MDESFANNESVSVSGSETATVETVIDYSEQLQIIIDQQQFQIGVSGFILGVLLVSIIFTVLSRYI